MSLCYLQNISRIIDKFIISSYRSTSSVTTCRSVSSAHGLVCLRLGETPDFRFRIHLFDLSCYSVVSINNTQLRSLSVNTVLYRLRIHSQIFLPACIPNLLLLWWSCTEEGCSRTILCFLTGSKTAQNLTKSCKMIHFLIDFVKYQTTL